jgi:hypothetical protein
MGTSHGHFIKYPRTPHLFAAAGTSDDKRLSVKESLRLIAEPSLVVEEKIDGTNVGIHFSDDNQLILQCRGHLITEGMHPQYDLFKRWASAKTPTLHAMLGSQFILFGEWMYAKHSIHYQKLTHYFFEFDIYDKQNAQFLTLDARLDLLSGTTIQTVPVIHRGPIGRGELESLIGASAFGSRFENPISGQTDARMEGVYLRTENELSVSSRAKIVRPEFVEKIKQSTHWQRSVMIPNLLADGVDIWS